MNSTPVARNVFLRVAAMLIASCGTATFKKSEAMPRSKASAILSSPLSTSLLCRAKKFNAAAFNANVNEGNAKFQQAIVDGKFTARRPVLVNLKGQFDADAAHLGSKASRGKITPAQKTESAIFGFLSTASRHRRRNVRRN